MASEPVTGEGLIVDKIYKTIDSALDKALDNDSNNSDAMAMLAMAEQAARTIAVLDKLGYEEYTTTEDDL